MTLTLTMTLITPKHVSQPTFSVIRFCAAVFPPTSFVNFQSQLTRQDDTSTESMTKNKAIMP